MTTLAQWIDGPARAPCRRRSRPGRWAPGRAHAVCCEVGEEDAGHLGLAFLAPWWRSRCRWS